ncbi:hypothetical protein BDW22DRAFT_1352862 [Trametopsis cervina]|nr:hypothetical protein BDW22DRAFT_1352862 [Trametopsis cervina]
MAERGMQCGEEGRKSGHRLAYIHWRLCRQGVTGPSEGVLSRGIIEQPSLLDIFDEPLLTVGVFSTVPHLVGTGAHPQGNITPGTGGSSHESEHWLQLKRTVCRQAYQQGHDMAAETTEALCEGFYISFISAVVSTKIHYLQVDSIDSPSIVT